MVWKCECVVTSFMIYKRILGSSAWIHMEWLKCVWPLMHFVYSLISVSFSLELVVNKTALTDAGVAAAAWLGTGHCTKEDHELRVQQSHILPSEDLHTDRYSYFNMWLWRSGNVTQHYFSWSNSPYIVWRCLQCQKWIEMKFNCMRRWV